MMYSEENESSASSTPALQSVRFSSTTSSLMDVNNSRTTSIHESLASQTATVTITQQNTDDRETQNNNDEVLPLRLRGRLAVTWDENVQDNEGLGRKKSKRCCIFHKERDFGESSTDSSDNNDSDDDSDSSESGNKDGSKKKKIARKKVARPKKEKVPNYQRYHA